MKMRLIAVLAALAAVAAAFTIAPGARANISEGTGEQASQAGAYAATPRMPAFQTGLRDGKPAIRFSWDKDENADGYVLYIDGQYYRSIASGPSDPAVRSLEFAVDELAAGSDSLAKSLLDGEVHTFQLRSLKTSDFEVDLSGAGIDILDSGINLSELSESPVVQVPADYVRVAQPTTEGSPQSDSEMTLVVESVNGENTIQVEGAESIETSSDGQPFEPNFALKPVEPGSDEPPKVLAYGDTVLVRTGDGTTVIASGSEDKLEMTVKSPDREWRADITVDFGTGELKGTDSDGMIMEGSIGDKADGSFEMEIRVDGDVVEVIDIDTEFSLPQPDSDSYPGNMLNGNNGNDDGSNLNANANANGNQPQLQAGVNDNRPDRCSSNCDGGNNTEDKTEEKKDEKKDEVDPIDLVEDEDE